MSLLTGSAYPISRSTGVCAATGRPLAEGERCVAVLVEREDGQTMERRDFAVDAWESGARPRPPLRMVGSWRTTVCSQDQKKKQLLSDEELLDLFEQMPAEGDARRLAFRYVLALLLIRRRLLRHEGTRRGDDGRSVLLVARRKLAGAASNPVQEVIDPGMVDDSIAAAVEQLSEIMATDAPASAPEARA